MDVMAGQLAEEWNQMPSAWAEIHQAFLMCWCSAFMFHMTYFETTTTKKMQPLWAIKMSEPNCEGGWTSYHKMKANKTMSHKFLKSTVKTSKNWSPSQGVSETVLRVKRTLKSIGFQLLSLGFRGMDIFKVNQDLDKPVEVNQELMYCARIWGEILAFLLHVL